MALTGHVEPEWAMRSEPDLWLALAQLEPLGRGLAFGALQSSVPTLSWAASI